eukprot:SAG31_NODE_1123_length_9787_cov_5.258877_2_plen_119_part_00
MEQYGYQKLEMIGRGSFGRVHKVRRTADDKILVIKQMVFGGLADAPAEAVKIRNMAEKESSLLQRLRHPNIVTFHECFLMPSLPHMKVPDAIMLSHALIAAHEGARYHSAFSCPHCRT